nr:MULTISPECIES: GntR family transcriptional regulator [unclassified Roseivivax]
MAGPSATLVDSLSLAIHEHRLLPGTKLGEDELSEIYKVSRTVVRSALQALSHLELVELKRNRGAFVSQPTVREAREVFEARALLEPRTARSAAERMTPEALARLEAHIAAEHAAIAEGAPGRALRLSGQFHIEISRIADQTTIAGFIERLVARSSLIIALYWRRQSALCEEHAHHALVEAFRSGDGTQAEDLMKSHLVDLVTALDLRDAPAPSVDLRDILAP